MEKSIRRTSLLVILVIFLCSTFSGCTSVLLEHKLFNRFYNTSATEAEAMLETLLAAIESGEAQTVKNLFSKHVQETAPNLNENISELFEFYKGEMISFVRYGPGSSASKEGQSYQQEIFCSFDVATTTSVYRIAFLFCTVDTESLDNVDNVGLTSVYIIRAEDSDMDKAYWGINNENDIWKPGINIE